MAIGGMMALGGDDYDDAPPFDVTIPDNDNDIPEGSCNPGGQQEALSGRSVRASLASGNTGSGPRGSHGFPAAPATF